MATSPTDLRFCRRPGRASYAAIMAGVFFCTQLHNPQASAAQARRSAYPRPLATRVYAILNLPSGSRPWLPSLARLIAAISPDIHAPAAVRDATFRRHLADARELVAALNTGADPIALRMRIMNCLNLDGTYSVPHGKKWRYGTLIDRLWLGSLLLGRALKLMGQGHKMRAARYARAELLIACQNSLWMGWRPCLFSHVRLHWNWKRRYGSLVNARELQIGLRFRRRLRAILDISGRQQAALDHLYAAGERQLAGRFGSAYNTLSVIGDKIVEASTKRALRHAREKCLRSVMVCIAKAPNIGWQFRSLRTILALRSQLNLSGYRHLSLQIKQMLQRWAAKIKSDRAMPRLERQALQRWIKEASI